MKVLLYRALALVGLRAGIGGLQGLLVAAFTQVPYLCRSCSEIHKWPRAHIANNDFALVAFNNHHVASLTARSSKRHGPLVLCFTGGKEQ